jgi:hypothetical protein
VSFLPAVPTLATLAFEVAGLHEFGRLCFVRLRARAYVRLLLGMIPYQVVLASAAARAVVREMVGARGWEKTEHLGAHRVAEPGGPVFPVAAGDGVDPPLPALARLSGHGVAGSPAVSRPVTDPGGALQRVPELVPAEREHG